MVRTTLTLTVTLLLVAGRPAFAEVPIEIAASGHPTVPVLGPFGVRQFVFDTGAEGSAVYADFADEAGLAGAGTEVLQGQTGATETALVKLDFLIVDGTRKEKLEAVRLDPRADAVPLAGIVGLDVFGDRTIDFDFPGRKLALLAPGKRPDGVEGDGLVATRTTGNLLTVPVTVSGVQAVAVIDTGARKTRINWKLGRLLGIDPKAVTRGDVIQGATNIAIETSATHVQDVRLGRRAIAVAPVLIADLPVFEAFGVADRPAIILGLDWLAEIRLVIDFPDRRVWFLPSH